MVEQNRTNINSNGYKSNLFRVVESNDGLGAGVLVPGNTLRDYVETWTQDSKEIAGAPATAVVDVHSQYPWTLSPVVARATTPVIEITEYKQVLSSELMGYAYSLAGTIDNFRVAAKTLPTAAAAVGAVTKQALNSLSLPSLAQSIGDLGNAVLNTGFVTGVENIQQMDKPAKEVSNQDVTKNDPNNKFLSPYRGLYAVEPTGFIYRLPYASPENFTQTNGWGDPEKRFLGVGAGLVNTLAGSNETSPTGGTTASKLGGVFYDAVKATMTAAGGVITQEKLKSYQGPQEVDKVTVKFILYNTVNFSDIKRNWELCYLLSYQNLPNRKGINLMDPPKLYRLLIPGYKQFPMCWVTNLSIKNLGAVRMMDIDDPNKVIVDTSNYSPSVKLIPEAYEINITFEHAFYSSQNLFAYALQPSNVVTTTVSMSETLQNSQPPRG